LGGERQLKAKLLVPEGNKVTEMRFEEPTFRRMSDFVFTSQSTANLTKLNTLILRSTLTSASTDVSTSSG